MSGPTRTEGSYVGGIEPAASYTTFGRVANCNPALADTNVAPAVGIGVYTRFLHGGVINAVALGVITAAGDVRIAIHRNTGEGAQAKPGELVSDTGWVACPAGGASGLAIPLPATITVNAGDWVSFRCQTAVPTLVGINNGPATTNSNLFAGVSGVRAADEVPVSNPILDWQRYRYPAIVGITPLT